MEAVRLTYESRIATLEETAAREKCAQERTINDLNQQVLQLTQKNQANRIFIEELSQERDSEREEMLKVTKNLEDARRANEKLTETLTSLRQSSEDTENQLRVAAGQTEALESLRKQLAEDLQVCAGTDWPHRIARKKSLVRSPSAGFSFEYLYIPSLGRKWSWAPLCTGRLL